MQILYKKIIIRQIKNRHTSKTKHNPEKANNTKYSKNKTSLV